MWHRKAWRSPAVIILVQPAAPHAAGRVDERYLAPLVLKPRRYGVAGQAWLGPCQAALVLQEPVGERRFALHSLANTNQLSSQLCSCYAVWGT